MGYFFNETELLTKKTLNEERKEADVKPKKKTRGRNLFK